MTTDPLTPARIAEMRARCDAATPVPWKWRGSRILDTGFPTADAGRPHGMAATVCRVEDPDAEFIVHARADMPALLDEVERVTRERDDLLVAVRDILGHYFRLLGEDSDA